MATLNRSPKRNAKTPSKTGVNVSYASRMSYSGGKGFGFRSQYGGFGLKSNAIANRSSFGLLRNEDRWKNQYVQRKDKNASLN
jgi:hypothetical protein